MNSWDRFEVPLPFCRGLFVYGEPIEVSPGASAEEMERARLRLELELNALSERAEREA